MRSDRCRLSGYMTLEASFIVPWVVFIIVWIIYLGYFEYDRCLLFQDNYSLATQTASRITDISGQNEWLNAHLRGQYGNKYMGTRHVEAQGEVSGDAVTVGSTLKVAHPLSFHADMIPAADWHISDRVCADNYSFTKRLRLFRAVGRVFDGG